MIKEIKVSTSSRSQFLNITGQVSREVSSSGIKEGVCTVYVPHTTAAVTINENADPDVMEDIKNYLDKTVPWSDPDYGHAEGNSAAHIKSSMMGSSADVIVSGGSLNLGTWQGIYFCEFDGPRSRRVWIKIIKD